VVDDERKVSGSETAKLRDTYIIVLVLGIIRSPHAAERWPVLAATGTHISVAFFGGTM